LHLREVTLWPMLIRHGISRLWNDFFCSVGYLVLKVDLCISHHLTSVNLCGQFCDNIPKEGKSCRRCFKNGSGVIIIICVPNYYNCFGCNVASNSAQSLVPCLHQSRLSTSFCSE
ncbi:hypothetical protein L9F63_017464, partial [Diploptera punctata]